MATMRPSVTVLEGGARAPSPLEAAYDHFRLVLQGDLVSDRTLDHYEDMLRPFLSWAADAGVRRFEELPSEVIERYRAQLAVRMSKRGRRLAPRSVLDSHKALNTFFRWASAKRYPVDAEILKAKRPRAAKTEPTVYHIRQVKDILAACNRKVPQEDLVVRLLVGSGVRVSETCGLSLVGPDGLSDLMLDSMQRGRVELRVRWDGGANGKKSRRVPITPKLAAAIKQYEARHRLDVEHPHMLINERGMPYGRFGIDAIMDRLKIRTGLRVHAHGFRHTFATVATKLGWNMEYLRAALGHADYKELQTYVRLATERDLGPRSEWLDFIVANPVVEWA
jgi:site-specific recombinase XerD